MLVEILGALATGATAGGAAVAAMVKARSKSDVATTKAHAEALPLVLARLEKVEARGDEQSQKIDTLHEHVRDCERRSNECEERNRKLADALQAELKRQVRLEVRRSLTPRGIAEEEGEG